MSSNYPVLAVVHQPTSNPGQVGKVLQELGFALDIRCPAIGQPLPTTLEHHSGTVVFGGPMSANDEHLDFIGQELDWITMALAFAKPYLGICLGAQLLARTLGASVAPHPMGQREIGYYPALPTPAGRDVFSGPLMVYQWHQEGFTLPVGSQLLATGSTFPHQAFGYGEQTYGLQFHPEITATMVNHWTTEGADQLTCPGAQGRAYHLSQHRLYSAAVERWLRQFLAGWLGVTAQAEAWGAVPSRSQQPLRERHSSPFELQNMAETG